MGRSQKELFRKIVAGKFEFDGEEWNDVSDEAKDLVRRMLVLNPDDRISSGEAIKHQWLKTSRDRLNLVTLQGASQRLKTFNARMKLRSAMIAVDWINSIQRMSFMSNRKLNGDASASSGGSGQSNPLLAAARKMKSDKDGNKTKK
jgi:serine/threonine protein kinase